MNITGSTNTCKITANTPFVQSGVTSGSADNITITDENGMSVTNCFGLTTEVIEFTTTSGETCNNVLEIVITEGVEDEVICDYTGTTLQNDGLILLTYSGGSTTLNVHPDCCIVIDASYTAEIGTEGYYVCRWREHFDATDCNNYTPTNTFDVDDYEIFNISTGGTTTIVPSAECCYNHGLVDELTNEGIKCAEPVVPVCSEYAVEANPPEQGDVEFTILSTEQTTLVVPTLECCTVNGLSGREVSGGYTCYKSLNPPEVSIALNSVCCEEEEVIIEPPVSGSDSNFDGQYYRYVLSPCDQSRPQIRVKTLIKVTNFNLVYGVLGSGGVGNDGKIAYKDNDLSPTTWILGATFGTICPQL